MTKNWFFFQILTDQNCQALSDSIGKLFEKYAPLPVIKKEVNILEILLNTEYKYFVSSQSLSGFLCPVLLWKVL